MGTVGDWLAGIGALFAACIAIWSTQEARIARDAERRAEADRQLEAEARSVVVALEESDGRIRITLANYGTRPISNLTVVAALARLSRGTPIRHSWMFPIVGPNVLKASDPIPSLDAREVNLADSALSYRFNDIYGHEWSRSGTELERRQASGQTTPASKEAETS
jgi:hypothetical protein